MYENTVIVIIGDNGRCNIRGKGYLFDRLQIPLIVKWAEGFEKPSNKDAVISGTNTQQPPDLAGVDRPIT